MRKLKFGIELEFLTKNGDEVVSTLLEKGIQIVDNRNNYNHNTKSVWKLVTDGSLSREGEYRGLELVSPILYGDEGLDELKVVMNTLVALGCKVNQTCGMHVHHDAGDFEKDNLVSIANLYYNYHSGINSVLAPSRRKGNSYCKRLDRTMLDRLNNVKESSYYDKSDIPRFQNSRYKTLNFKSYLRYGTVEFRQHQGSINFDKAEAWIIFTFMMMCHAKDNAVTLNEKSRGKLVDLLELVNLNDTYVGNYLIKRAKELKKCQKDQRNANRQSA